MAQTAWVVPLCVVGREFDSCPPQDSTLDAADIQVVLVECPVPLWPQRGVGGLALCPYQGVSPVCNNNARCVCQGRGAAVLTGREANGRNPMALRVQKGAPSALLLLLLSFLLIIIIIHTYIHT